MLVQHSTIGAHERFCWNYMSIREALLVQQCTIGVLWLCWYSRVLKEQSVGCDGTAVYLSIIGALGRLCWYRRVRKEHSGGCAGTAEYYRNTRAGTAEY